jgi:uncharacterized C2H2 Zn-finger protein
MQEQTQVTCSQCGQSFESQEELDRHNREEHGMNEDGSGSMDM